MNLDARVEELKKRFREALELLEKGDAVQASEKLYKVAENAVKILSEMNRILEYEKACQKGTWWTRLLDKAAKRLGNIYGEEVLDAWTTAYELHQKGFTKNSSQEKMCWREPTK